MLIDIECYKYFGIFLIISFCGILILAVKTLQILILIINTLKEYGAII